MTEPRIISYGQHVDERGTLVAIEFADVPFTVRRVFTVAAPLLLPETSTRGNHVNSMNAVLVLSRGACTVHLGDEGQQSFDLTTPGDGVYVPSGTYIVYEFADPTSAILVLADRSFAESRA